jgi:hypothetical protein
VHLLLLLHWLLLLPLPVLLNSPQQLGCPILRGFCEGWDVRRLRATTTAVAVACSSFSNPRTVISTLSEVEGLVHFAAAAKKPAVSKVESDLH